ncbi:hypothetical protein KIPB_016088, partial [Kipferlia bialata]|eukprot:g16088.t1
MATSSKIPFIFARFIRLRFAHFH